MKNQRGSIVLAIMVTLMVGVLAYSVADSSRTLSQSAHNFGQDYGAAAMQDSLQQLLSTRSLCTSALQFSSVSVGAESPVSFLIRPSLQFAEGVEVMNSTLRVNKLRIRNPAAAGTDVVGNRIFSAQLYFEVAQTDSIMGGFFTQSQTIPNFQFSLDTAGNINGCWGTGSTDAACTLIGGQLDMTVANHCRMGLNPKAQTCPANSFVSSISPQGEIACKSLILPP